MGNDEVTHVAYGPREGSWRPGWFTGRPKRLRPPLDGCVLLTGASTGLGLAIARQLLACNYRVILTARASSLGRFADAGIVEGERVWLRPLDVTSSEQRRAIVEEAEENWGGVDVLINNAGVSYRAVVEHVTEQERITQMDINFRSPMNLARLVLPGMRDKGCGRILNISSVGGMMAMPTMAVYSASKFALEGATEALWYEVRPWGIDVSLIQPGFINSSGFRNVRFTELSGWANQNKGAPYAAHYRNMTTFIESLMGRVRATPDRVARVVVKTMRRRVPPLRVQATADARMFTLLRRVLPRRTYHWLLYRNLPKVRRWGPPDETPVAPSTKELPRPATDSRQ